MPRMLTTSLVILLCLVGPATALACSPLVRGVLEPRISPADLRFPARHVGQATDWNVSPMMSSFHVQLDQAVKHPRTGRPLKAAFAQQRTLRVQLPSLETRSQYESAASGTCNLAGQSPWSNLRVLVRETADAVYITSVARYSGTPNEHCTIALLECPGTRNVRLSSPIGDRTVYLSRYARSLVS